jgi:rod shape-determining protein MreD
MLIDLAPPGNGPVGISALILTAVGLVAGRYENPRDRSVPVALAVVAVSAAAAAVLGAGLETVFGNPRVAWDHLASMSLLSALYALLMAPPILGLVMWVVRKLTPEALL